MVIKRLLIMGLASLVITFVAKQSVSKLPPSLILEPLEIFVVGPMEQNHLAIWIPANKMGPEINRSCRTRTGCQYNCSLTGDVDHSKSDLCPDSLARLTAVFLAPLHQDRLPLTIFNGWQWEFRYGLSQFESVTYDLASNGSWENCLEAVLHQGHCRGSGQWLRLGSDGPLQEDGVEELHSQINITTYSGIRTRHGYPKIRPLEE